MGSSPSEEWDVSVSTEWDVLGPFPIHAREQHFLSPSFPLNLSHSEPVELHTTYPSSYADGGFVGWTKAHSQEDGTLQVSFPSIRWESLRATEGWAALQHHSLLRTTLTVYPPSGAAQQQHLPPPRLTVNLLQGSYFTVRPLPGADVGGTPEWHMGNIYAMGSAPPNTVELPAPPSLTGPTTYELVVSGDYEIRLFGDPRHGGAEVPTLSITLTVGIEGESPSLPVIRALSHDTTCDFVDGWAFGDAIGVGIRSLQGWWTVTSVRMSGDLSEGIELALLQETRIASTQTRIVPFKLTQSKAISSDRLDFTVQLQSDDSKSTEEIHVSIPIKQRARWTSTDAKTSTALKASYLFGTSMPTAFLVVPPVEPNNGSFVPPILALHGAGLDIFDPQMQAFWVKAVPRQRHSWIILPSGRTSWGLDWHGPSTREALATVDALHSILSGRPEWDEWGLAPETQFLLMGHSNGGQGAWYLAERHPERVIAVVPAAGYIKSQSYVPWVQSRSAHYVDPGLRAILDSSLTPDDNDLFLSNLVDTPVLAIHGGDDDNVPVWHTREAVSVLKTWNPQANVTFREDPGEGHWYDDIFLNHQVQTFVSKALEGHEKALSSTSRSYTLTVASPADVGSLHGWRIHKLRIPGRLARLSVDVGQDAVRVRSTNVEAFSLRIASLPTDVQILVDGQTLELDEATWDLPDFTLALSQKSGVWTPYAPSDIPVAPPTGRIANFLTTSAPIVIVMPDQTSSRLLSAALRIAHTLDVYHNLDAEIIEDEEAARRLKEGSLGSGNMVVLNSGELSGFATTILDKRQTPFRVRGGTLELCGRLLNEPSMATLFLHPHPIDANSLALFLYGADLSGLERGLRLFPIRTGVAVPDWIVIGSLADERGSGGVEGAGVWGNDWSWNEAMSAF
ncbi:hypothetical protein C8T65DRAFT_708227 [Cerioporus squamosus]|nr:hypothetical protein C8T65DRAFT_708227 [Cerioporus squamosus]